jgi:hypothetical protein
MTRHVEHLLEVAMKVNRSLRSIQLVLGVLLMGCPLVAQISGTGAISGVVRDSSGALVPGASITARDLATGLTRHMASSARGDYAIQLLEPGHYSLTIAKEGFATSNFSDVTVNVTQVTGVNVTLSLGSAQQTVQVQASGELLQTEASTVGSVVTGQQVRNLPLVSRNYTQIITLSPGISSDVTDAGAFGRGTTTVVAAGTNSSENNFQMDGVEINDLQASGSFSGGIAIPNPDTIAEFKVQTSQYDASYGRNAGANVNLVTKTGSNQFHGSIWEFFRNEDLNANSYFLKQQGQARPVLRQNQPGFTFDGPIKQDKVFFFTSYQSTRQVNGVDAQCSTSLNTPPLTNNRSRAALGALFAGQPTFIQELGLPLGPNVLPDGSNIAPQALALFNLKLANGQYAIPTPQRIDPSLPFAAQGVSTISDPCRFNEDQFMTNADWNQTAATQWQVRFFFANSQQAYTLPTANLGGATAPGFPQDTPNHFRNFSVLNNHIFNPNLLNQAEFGFHRTWVDTAQQEQFQYSDLGAMVPSFDTLPAINFLGSITLGGNGQTVVLAQDTWVYQDTVSWTQGKHAFRFGGGVTQVHNNIDRFQFLGGLIFGTFPDALLGQSAAQNGTPFSNMFLSIDLPGELQRQFRTLDYNVYGQDDYKVTPRLTLNLGFRYDRIGDISDALGRTSNFDIHRANPNPPASGSLNGFVVGSNFSGTIPAGVTRSSSLLGIAGNGQNTLNPRIGFAYQLPNSDRVVLRGGYGIYHETPTGQPNLQLLLNPPFSQFREFVGAGNGAANWATPLPPFTSSFPSFTPYSPTTALSLYTFANNFRPAVIQHFSLNTQTALTRNTVLEVGYLGTRAQHILITRLPNQALSASPANPIRGETTNTQTNIGLRVPIPGFNTSTFNQIESSGSSWYHALLVNFTQRFKNGSQAQVAYTWSRSLSDTVNASTGANGGTRTGDQNNPRADYGPDFFNRPQRLVANFVYQIPTPFRATSLAGEALGGWGATGVITIQSGHNLTVTNTNAFNVFGINGADQDFGQIAPGCSNYQLGTPGKVTGKLKNYFNQRCFFTSPGKATAAPVPYPVVGADGVATGFGNSKPGLLRGPAQNNVDFALQKAFSFHVRGERANGEFRTELFNAFNAPQFGDPNTNLDSPIFGVINTTAVAPRIMQLAVKLSF